MRLPLVVFETVESPPLLNVMGLAPLKVYVPLAEASFPLNTVFSMVTSPELDDQEPEWN